MIRSRLTFATTTAARAAVSILRHRHLHEHPPLADQLRATTEPETPPHDLRPSQCNHHGALVRRGRKRKGFASSSNAIHRRKPFIPSPACPNTDAIPANTSGWTTNWPSSHFLNWEVRPRRITNLHEVITGNIVEVFLQEEIL